MKTRNFMRAFSGGELSPRMTAHVESPQVQTGCAKLRNMICEPTGPVFNRPGFRFVKEVKNSAAATRIIPFKFAADEQIGIELGAGYFRFFANGAHITASPSPFRFTTQIAAAQTLTFTDADVNVAADTITLGVHGLVLGQRIVFSTTGALPGGFGPGVPHYVASPTTTTIKISLFPSTALPTNIVSNSGGGTHTVTYGRDTIVTSTPHNLSTGDRIRFDRAPGGAIPAPLALYTTYHAIVLTSTSFRIATTPENAAAGVPLLLTDNGSGTQFVHRVYKAGDLVTFSGASYCARIDSPVGITPAAQSPVSASLEPVSDLVTSTAHQLFEGTAITFQKNGGFLPPEIVEGVTYYAKPTTANAFEVSATYGGPTVNFTDSSSGSVTWTRVQPWYQMPADGTVEIPNGYAAADLFEINFFQSNDVVTLLHRKYPASELRRLSATSWTLSPIQFSAKTRVPTGLAITPDYGRGIEIRSLDTTDPTFVVLRSGTGSTDAEHKLSAGEVLFIPRGVLGSITVPGFYLVHDAPTVYTFRLQRVGTATQVGSSSTTVSGNPKAYRSTLAVDTSQSYVVTAVGLDGGESQASAAVSVSNNLDVDGSSNTLTWNAVPDARLYRVYRQLAGLYGLIGSVNAPDYTGAQDALGLTPPTVTFLDRDDNPPDLGETPPLFDTEIGPTTGFPAAGCYFETRRFFACTDAFPQRTYGTASNTESHLSYHFPVKETDRLQFDIAAREQNQVRHLVPMAQLLALTNGAEFRISPINSDALAPGSIAARAQTYIGASFVRPQIVNNSMLFVAARGGHVFEFGFSNEAGSFRSGDVSLRASHLFDRYDIVDSAFGRAPFPIAWYVSTSGQLLGLTYVPEEGIGGWHVHETDGTFESVCVVSEGFEDILYAVVRRVINGVVKRFVERMDPMTRGVSMAEQFFVDCGVTTSTPGATISLPHLEGKTVVALVDGKLQSPKVVTGGVIPASPAVVGSASAGLPYTATLRPLAAAYNLDDFGRSRNKNPAYAFVDVVESCAFSVGNGNPDQVPILTVDLSKADMLTKRIRTPIPEGATDDGTVEIIQSDPLPITIVGLGLDTAIGG